jgi:hypothetical protein
VEQQYSVAWIDAIKGVPHYMLATFQCYVHKLKIIATYSTLYISAAFFRMLPFSGTDLSKHKQENI